MTGATHLLLLALCIIHWHLSTATASTSDTGTETERLRARVDAAADALERCVGFPGMSLSVVRLADSAGSGAVRLTRGYGVRDVDSGRAVGPDTRFCIGSVTKAFTAALLAQLLADSNGTYNLETTVRSVLGADFELCTADRTERTTMRDMLSHSVGIAKHFGGFLMGYNFSRAELVRRMRHLPPVKPFRESRVFNNFMYVMAGQVLEKLNGSWWESQIVQKFLKPLNMARTTFADRVPDWSDDFALPHALSNGTRVPLRPKVTGNILRPIGPAGSICSTANDMSEWLHMSLNGGTSREGVRVLGATVADDLLRIHNAFPTPLSLRNHNLVGESLATGYGLGWVVGSYRGTKRVFHSGFSNYYYSMISLLPEKGIGIYASFNGPHLIKCDNGMKALHFFLMDLLLGQEPWLNESSVCAYPRPWATETPTTTELPTTELPTTRRRLRPTSTVSTATSTLQQESPGSTTIPSSDSLTTRQDSLVYSTGDIGDTTDTSLEGMWTGFSTTDSSESFTIEFPEQNTMDPPMDTSELPEFQSKQTTTEGSINDDLDPVRRTTPPASPPKPLSTRRRRPLGSNRPSLHAKLNSSIISKRRRPGSYLPNTPPTAAPIEHNMRTSESVVLDAGSTTETSLEGMPKLNDSGSSNFISKRRRPGSYLSKPGPPKEQDAPDTLTSIAEILLSSTTDTSMTEVLFSSTTDTSLEGMSTVSDFSTDNYPESSSASESPPTENNTDQPMPRTTDTQVPAIQTEQATTSTTESHRNTETLAVTQSVKPSLTRKRRPLFKQRPTGQAQFDDNNGSDFVSKRRRPDLAASNAGPADDQVDSENMFTPIETEADHTTTSSNFAPKRRRPPSSLLKSKPSDDHGGSENVLAANATEFTTTGPQQSARSRKVFAANNSPRQLILRRPPGSGRQPWKPKSQRTTTTAASTTITQTTAENKVASQFADCQTDNSCETTIGIAIATTADTKTTTTTTPATDIVFVELSKEDTDKVVTDKPPNMLPSNEDRSRYNIEQDRSVALSELTPTQETTKVATLLRPSKRPLRRRTRPRRSVFAESKLSKFEGNYYNPFFGNLLISTNRTSKSLQLNYGYYGKAILRPLPTGTEHIYRMEFFNSIWYQSNSDDMKLFTKLGMFDVQFGVSKIDGVIDKLVVFIFDTEKPPLFMKEL